MPPTFEQLGPDDVLGHHSHPKETSAPTPEPSVPPTFDEESDEKVQKSMNKHLTADYKKDHDCDNKPNWDSDCPHLVGNCGTSLVVRMKCRKTCGSCKQTFEGIPEPKDPPAPVTPKKIERMLAEERESQEQELREAKGAPAIDSGLSSNAYMAEASDEYDELFGTATYSRKLRAAPAEAFTTEKVVPMTRAPHTGWAEEASPIDLTDVEDESDYNMLFGQRSHAEQRKAEQRRTDRTLEEEDERFQL